MFTTLLPKGFTGEIFSGDEALSSLKPSLISGKDYVFLTTPGMIKRKATKDFDALFTTCGIHPAVKTIDSNPDVDGIDTILQELLVLKKDFAGIIAFGGGSVLDGAKVLAVLLTQPSLSLDAILRHKTPFADKRIPLCLIPTTSGTGAEITPFATIWDMRDQIKRSLATPALLPDTIILSPKLTADVPLEVSIDCALDSCSHALESLWNKHSSLESRTIAQKALSLWAEGFPLLLKCETSNLAMRQSMQEASFLAGCAIAHNKTAIAHSISYPVTLKYNVPHGLACSFTLLNIIRLISQENAWYSDIDRSLLDNIKQLLEAVELDKRIAKYASLEEIFQLKDEMLTDGRADNFILPTIDFEKILLDK